VTEVFGAAYAAAYDALYREKDYEAECDLIEEAARRFAKRPVSRILDLGCGTGGHVLPLSRRGYEVVGVDRSEEMLSLARRKSTAAGVSARYVQGDLRSVRLGERFDLVTMMFAVLGYQLSDDDVSETLATCRMHLQPGGILVFDFWHGPAVLAEGPEERVRQVPTSSGEITRTSFGRLQEALDVCTVRFHVVERAGRRIVGETVEEHAMRYFFPDRLAAVVRSTGFGEVRFSAFPTLDRKPGPADWNAIVVAVVDEGSSG
jgi:SAM-dependent methyltransferase